MNAKNSKTTGTLGERLAVEYLKSKGYRILEQNFFLRVLGGPKIAEVDIITRKGEVFVFVEVKTIKANGRFLAQDKINEVKKWKIAKAAEAWLIKHNVPLDVKWRIDAIAVELLPDTRPPIIRKLLGPRRKISHFENISCY